MDKKLASSLLLNLIQRIDLGQITGFTALERAALTYAQGALGDGDGPTSAPPPTPAVPPTTDAISKPEPVARVPLTALPQVTLNLKCLDQDVPSDPDVLLCLDFGTAMSKAFAFVQPANYIDLSLGVSAGGGGYAVPSSVFVGADGKAYFGFEAIAQSDGLAASGRERLDSIKTWLSLSTGGDLDSESRTLKQTHNPTGVALTQGDAIRIYLAYLTDLAGGCLAHNQGNPNRKTAGRYVLRRFARPCWPEKQAKWADEQMKRLLCDAQVLADTFSGQWLGGIAVAKLKAAIEQIKQLGARPSYLIDVGVPEPVAVAAGAVVTSENFRDYYLVVDAGAGTTDFGFFYSGHTKSGEAKVFQVPSSIHGLMHHAGNKVDELLRDFIRRKHSIERSSPEADSIERGMREQSRAWKELLFRDGKVDYLLVTGDGGTVVLKDFAEDEAVKQFGAALEKGLRTSLEALDDSYLEQLARDPVRLNMVVTGGSASLSMVKALGSGVIEIRGFKIMRSMVTAMPEWMAGKPKEFREAYLQLAVAIGGASDDLPEANVAPDQFPGSGARSQYEPGRFQVSGT
ncbi:MAG: hypothetical protein ACT6S0_03880 [Roseateles sp.]|uniref:hypothetical protein n=1 Tax=Roseateles sp. TaxID=1971397 RepID=UPI004036A564